MRGLDVIFSLAMMAATLQAQSSYKVIDQWKIGGEGGWDYLLADSSAHRLYVSHATRIEVLDTLSGKVVGAITGLHGTHGIALDPESSFGYITDGGGNAVVVFDRATLAVVKTIPAGVNPDSIAYEPATKTVWVFNGRSRDASVIDAASQKVIATLPLPGRPEAPAVDGQGLLFLPLEDKNKILKIDTRARRIVATWEAGCEAPTGMAIDPAGERLFPVCDGNKMSVLDYASGKLLATASIGDGPDSAGWNAARQLVFASSADGILAVVDASAPGYPTLQKLATRRGAKTMTYDPVKDRVYLSVAEMGVKPAPTAELPRPKAPVTPGSFSILVVGR